MQDQDVKLCPECGAEYFAHVDECADCEKKLLTPAELAEHESLKQGRPETPSGFDPDGPLVCIDAGPYARVAELASALEAAGIERSVSKTDQPAGAGCSKEDLFLLLVPRELEESAQKALEQYWHKLHPEIKKARERLDQGLCPCCSTPVGDRSICPECGLEMHREH